MKGTEHVNASVYMKVTCPDNIIIIGCTGCQKTALATNF